jgi:hypothetical protein
MFATAKNEFIEIVSQKFMFYEFLFHILSTHM